MELSVKDGKICNQNTMREMFEKFGEVVIVDETNGFGLNFVEEAASGFGSTTPPRDGSSTVERYGFLNMAELCL